MEVTRKFTRDRDTKNKVVFQEVILLHDGFPMTPVIGTFYIDKSIVKDAQSIEVTIKVDN